MKTTLTIHEDPPRTVTVDSREFLIGRAGDCDLQLKNPLVSRHHCVLTEHGGRIYVRDLQSSNGTGLNNQILVGERPLSSGTELWVATTLIEVDVAEERAGAVHRGADRQDLEHRSCPWPRGRLADREGIGGHFRDREEAQVAEDGPPLAGR